MGVNESPDPERLLAEALRAQAVRAPMSPAQAQPAVPTPTPTPTPAPVPVPAGRPVGDPDPVLQLMSGPDSQPDLWSDHLPTAATTPQHTARLTSPAPLSAWWIVTLALLLGLAAGAVVGLVSVL